ncbi:MAG: glycosyltransferase family 2 protein [Bacteroidia bacterium]|nr:glycosyltransferase family 2 protein [Bacteroidia bacterium]
MEISVIIPSYNGAHKICHTLRALALQSLKAQGTDFEVLVVVDGSTDHTREVLSQSDFDLPNLRILYRENGGRAVARNTGARAAQGDLLVFFDDDIRPIPQCLEMHRQHHQQKPRTILVGNPLEDESRTHTDIQRYKLHLSRKWVEPLRQNEGLLDEERLFLTAANFSLSKETFFQLNGFDEALRDAEDFDLGFRAMQQHIPIYFNIDLIGWHDEPVSCQSFIRRGRQYVNAHHYLKNHRPELYGQWKHYDFKPVGIFKKIIYQLFAQRLWVKAVDQFNIFRPLPRKVRYKVYDLITTSLIAHFPDKKI